MNHRFFSDSIALDDAIIEIFQTFSLLTNMFLFSSEVIHLFIFASLCMMLVGKKEFFMSQAHEVMCTLLYMIFRKYKGR